jgi:hypothetical protein
MVMSDGRQHAPATARNREPIRDVLARELPPQGTVLEIASGSGEHAVYFAGAFPGIAWQPSDTSDAALASIEAWRAEAQLANLRAPVVLDATWPLWPVASAEAIVCINMVHISPWEAALGLFAGASRLLMSGALLYLYGPFRFDGAFSAGSNAAFDQSLRARDPRWGVRDASALEAAARAQGLVLRDTIEMPANNHSLVFRKG